MDLQWLITFKAILETGSFTSAADKLGYTQSTVTSHIHQLEQELSVKLFDKIGRNMYLSEAGRVALPKIDQITDLMMQLKMQNSPDELYTGKLRLAIVETILQNKMQPVLKQFMDRAPNVEVQIINTSCYTAREALKRGEVDIGLLYLDVAGRRRDDLLTETPLAEIPMALVGSGTHEVGWDMEKALPSSAQTYYFNDPKCVFHDIYKAYLERHGLSVGSTMALGSIDTQLKMIENGSGISYLPRYVVEDRLARGSLRELPINTEENTVYIAYSVHKNKSISPSMALFIDLIKNAGLFERN